MKKLKDFIMKQSENSKDKKIAFVYDKLHPIHKRLMESIKADFMHYSEKIKTDGKHPTAKPIELIIVSA